MATDWGSILGGITSLLGIGSASGAADDAAASQASWLDFLKNYIGQQQGYQEPWQQYGTSTLGGISSVTPTMQNWLMALSGTPEGTSWTSPTQANTAIPQYLRSALQTGSGPLYEAAKTALSTGVDQSAWADFMKDTSGGSNNVESEMNRRITEGRWQTPGAGYTMPSLTTGGESYTVPGMSELPTWLQPASSALTTALTETPDWKNPYTAEQLTQLMEPAELSSANYANQVSGAMQTDLARRGLGGTGYSSVAGMPTSGKMGWLDMAQAQNKQNAIGMIQGRGDQLRAENIANLLTGEQVKAGEGNKWQNLLNTLFGNATTAAGMGNQSTGTIMNAAQNQAGSYGNLASMYGGMASQAGSNLGNFFANWMASQNASKVPSVYGNTAGTSGIYNDKKAADWY